MRPPEADVAGALRPWLAARLAADDLVVTELRRHDEGFSWRTYTLSAEWTDGAGGGRLTRGFAVRLEPLDGLLAPYDVAAQYRLHAALLERSDVPLPALDWLELDGSVLGAPFYVMERIEGTVPVQWAGDDPASFPTAAAREAVGVQFAAIQARIHAVDWRGSGLGLPPAHDPAAAAAAVVEQWAGFYERSALLEVPVVRYAIAWLRQNVVCSGRLALCHGDYRIGNFMVRDGGIVAIFDWELAHVGDPVEDVAYTGLPLWRGRGTRVSQLLEPADYLAGYAEHGGIHVDPDVLRFWTVLGLVKAAAVHLRAARAFEDGRTGDLRLAALGHQVHHVARFLADELRIAA